MKADTVFWTAFIVLNPELLLDQWYSEHQSKVNCLSLTHKCHRWMAKNCRIHGNSFFCKENIRSGESHGWEQRKGLSGKNLQWTSEVSEWRCRSRFHYSGDVSICCQNSATNEVLYWIQTMLFFKNKKLALTLTTVSSHFHIPSS